MNTTSLSLWSVLCALTLSGCATNPLATPSDTQQRSDDVVELSQESIVIDLQPQADATDSIKSVMPSRQSLTVKQRTIPERTPAQARRELAALTGRLDQNTDLCAGLHTDTQPVTIPRVVKPPYLTYYADPTFRSKVIRISDTQPGEIVKPMYSTIQSWNVDESLMILYHSGGRDRGHHLYDGRSYQHIRNLEINPADIEQVFWSHTEPDYFYYVSKGRSRKNQLLKSNARTRKVTRIADLSPMCGRGEIATAGNDVHMQSWDDDLFAFRCKSGIDANMYMHTYRLSTGEVRSQRIGPGTSWDSWLAPNPTASGNRLLMNGKVIGTDLTTEEHSLDMDNFNEHSSIGKTKAGNDALFAVAFDPSPSGCGDQEHQGVGHLVEHNLETGDCRAQITESMGYPYTTSGTHVSAVAHLRPGWVLLSSVGFPDDFASMSNGKPAPSFFSEIYLANTDVDNPAVCRVAQHRSFGKGARNGGYNGYFGEPHATISPSGTRIVFGSDWYDSGSVDAYVIELPAYSR